jgi:hypothetical protein
MPPGDFFAALFADMARSHLASDGRIATLRIIYDTAFIRPVFEEQTGRRSWHGSPPASD